MDETRIGHKGYDFVKGSCCSLSILRDLIVVLSWKLRTKGYSCNVMYSMLILHKLEIHHSSVVLVSVYGIVWSILISEL